MIKFSAIILLSGLALILSACSFSLAEDITPPPNYQPPTAASTQANSNISALYPVVPPNPANGQAIYTEKCAPCHGETGLGDGPQAAQLPNPVAAIGSPEIARKSIPATWYAAITNGNIQRYMPPFASLSEGQRWDVIAYIYSLSASSQQLTRGAELYQQNCASCHGASGKGDGAQAAASSQPLSSFTGQAFMAKKSNQDFFKAISDGVSPNMPAYAKQLSEEDRWALVDYTRSLGFTTGALASAPTGTLQPAASGTPAASPEITSTQATTGTAATGTITGTVTNGSGGSLPSGLEITLHGFDNMQIAITGTTTLHPDGTFAFPNIAMPNGRVFLASTVYSNATYGSSVVTADGSDKVAPLDIKVFDTTTDTSALSADRMHIFFDFSQPGTVQLIELYIISNTGKKSVVAPQQGSPILKYSLPDGATNLQFQDGSLGGRYVEIPGGFGDTQPIQPGSGEFQMLYAFNLPYDRKLDLKQPVNMPVNALVVLLPEGGVSVKGSQLNDNGTRPVQGTNYHMYSGGSLAAGSTLSLSISGSPGSSASFLSNPTNRINLAIGLGSLGFVLTLAGFILYRRNRQLGQEEEDESEEAGDLPLDGQDADNLMDAIIALDDLYKEGGLPEEAYYKRRTELKNRLKEIEEAEG